MLETRPHTSRWASLIGRAKTWARGLGRDVSALYRSARDARTPWYAKAVAACVVGYALSPVDLIPDFIPVIGLLDDLLIVPLGIALAIRLVPAEVLAEYRDAADQSMRLPVGWTAAVVVAAIWLMIFGVAAALAWPYFQP